MTDLIKCKYCSSENIIKFGSYKVQSGKVIQRYFCKNCNRKFVPYTLPKMQTPTTIIASVLEMYYNGIHVNEIQKQIELRTGKYFSEVGIYKWIIRFTRQAINYSKNFIPNVGDIWILNEMSTNISSNNQKLWFWDIIDIKTKYLLSSYVARSGNDDGVDKLIKTAIQRAGKMPEEIITDKVNMHLDNKYLESDQIRHIKIKPFITYSNVSRKEYISLFKERIKVLGSFKKLTLTQLITDGWGIHNNFFREYESLDNKSPAQVMNVPVPFNNWNDVLYAIIKESTDISTTKSSFRKYQPIQRQLMSSKKTAVKNEDQPSIESPNLKISAQGVRSEELEFFFSNFSDMPREVIVKEDILRLGLRFSKEAISFAKTSSAEAGRDILNSVAKVRYDALREKLAMHTPLSIWLEGGKYDLRRIIVENRLNLNSPYLVDIVDGQVLLFADRIPIGKVKFPPVPGYYSKRFGDGTWYREILPINSWTMYAFDVALRFCQFNGKESECKFCDINKHTRQKMVDRTRSISYNSYKSTEKIAEVAKEIFSGLYQPLEDRALAILITGGSIIEKVDGKDENAFYLDHVTAIRSSVGYRWPLILQTQAKNKYDCKNFRDKGVDVHCANIEVWDEKLFKWICPGKEATIGRDEWHRRVMESVDIFGEGNVTPNFVTGVEMAQPYGFMDVSSAVKSTTAGLEYLMSHGVIPKFDTWNITPWSRLAGNKPPPLEYYVRIDKAWYEIWRKYNLPPINGMGPMGPGRAINFISAHIDMGEDNRK